MQRLNSAIIGCGSICSIHAEAIRNITTANLYAFCDIDSSKSRAVAQRYNCISFTQIDEVLKDQNIDIIHICTPHYLHADMAIQAMKAGKHVLAEKPMSISVAEAEEMIKVSKQTGKKLGICFQNRYNNTSVRIKEILESGKCGKILGGKAFVTWYRDEAYYKSNWRGTWEKEGGGVLINQAVHTLDLLQWFIGDEVDFIKADIATRLLEGVIQVEDTVDAAIVFKHGTRALFYATNCYVVNSPVEIELVCENAVIRLYEELTVKYNDGRIEKVPEIDRTTGERAYWGYSHKLLISDFYNNVLSGQQFCIDGEQGIKVIRIIDAIYKGSNTRRIKE